MTAQIFKFPQATPEQKAELRAIRAMRVAWESRAAAPESPPAGTTECRATSGNLQLRKDRKDDWRAAEAAVQYWKIRMEFVSVIERVQRLELPEGDSHPASAEGDRYAMVEKRRAALVRQLLTPAPDINSVKWKQAKLSSGELRFCNADPFEIERAIADDLAFLAAHPVRQSKRRKQA